MERKANEIIGIIAPKGSGKTHLATSLVQKYDRAVIFDLMSEDQWASVADEIVIGSPAQFAAALHAEKFRIVYRPVSYDPVTLQSEGFEWFCRLAYLRGDLTIVVDEAHLVCTPHNIPKPLQVIPRLGRHRKVSLLYVTQSFTQVERSLTLNTNNFYFFKNVDPNDQEGITKRCGKDVADCVRNLRKLDINFGRPGEILIWSDSGHVKIIDLASNKNLTPDFTSVIDSRRDEARPTSSSGHGALPATRTGDSGEDGLQMADLLMVGQNQAPGTR